MSRAATDPRHPDVLRRRSIESTNCLWAVLVLARLHDVDLAAEFLRMTDDLERALTGRLNHQP